jgi:tRNA(Ile)-lysidine synthase
MLEKVKEKLAFIGKDQRIAIALSGGSDSMALVEILLELGRKVIALIVDHKMREESTREALLVKSWIKNKLPVEILTWQEGEKVTKNLQARAREGRYQLLLDYCKKNNIKFLTTAHHKEDQAETILLNIFRGTGLEGLVGIREKSDREGVIILRPFLDLKKSQLKNYLSEKNLAWIEDPSNEKNCYERVKVRKILTELEKSQLVNKDKILDRLSLLGENAKRNQAFLQDYLDQRIKKIVVKDYQLVKILDWEGLKNEKEEIMFRIFKKFLGKKVRLLGIKNLYQSLLEKNKSTLGGFILQISGENLFISRENQSKGESFLKKNQIKQIKTFLLQGHYKIVEKKSCSEALEIIKIFPKLDFFTSLPYQITNKEIIIPNLGIALDRFKLD